MAVTLPRLSGAMSQDYMVSVLNQVIDFINSSQRTTIINDGTTNRYLIGYQKDGWGAGKDFGIKVSKPGIDVTEASDDDLLFKNDFATEFWYNDTNNYRQDGLLPDGRYGFAIAAPGNDVQDGF